MISKTLSHYEVTSQLGRGGMGEFFQAKDQLLGRGPLKSCLKNSPGTAAARVDRFQREGKVLASLNHANIAAIRGLEESGRTSFSEASLV